MSEKICALKKKGSSGGKTLWTNSNPSANFVAQTITLSDSVDNYDHFVIECNQATSNTTKFYAYGKKNSNGWFAAGLKSDYSYARYFSFTANNNQLYFDNCGIIGQATTINNVLIPVKVYGYK